MKTKKGALAGVLFGMLMMLMSTVSNGQSINDIVKRGKVLIGVNSGAPPFSFVDEKGVAMGYDVDTANLFGKYLGVPVEIVPFTTPARIPALEAGKVGSWVWDIRSGEVACNDMFRRMYGLSEAAKVRVEDVLGATHAADRARVEGGSVEGGSQVVHSGDHCGRGVPDRCGHATGQRDQKRRHEQESRGRSRRDDGQAGGLKPHPHELRRNDEMRTSDDHPSRRGDQGRREDHPRHESIDGGVTSSRFHEPRGRATPQRPAPHTDDRSERDAEPHRHDRQQAECHRGVQYARRVTRAFHLGADAENTPQREHTRDDQTGPRSIHHELHVRPHLATVLPVAAYAAKRHFFTG